MAYTPVTHFPEVMNYGQWSRPGVERPRLAVGIDNVTTTIQVTNPFKNYLGAVITGSFLMGIHNENDYVEHIWVPAGAVSVDGKTLTGVVRGVRLNGLDHTTGDSSLAASARGSSAVFCNIAAVNFEMMVAAMQGGIGSGGASWKVGKEVDENITVYAFNADANKPFFQYNAATNQWVYSNDGVSSTPFGTGAGVTGGDGISVTAGDIDIDLTDTVIFKSTSAGAGDSGKVPRLNASGLISTTFGSTVGGTVGLVGTDSNGRIAGSFGTVPIGAIVAWAKSLGGVPALPDCFVECNGQVLADAQSPLNGSTIPNLNASGGGTKRFLRGSTTSGTTGGEDTHTLTVNEMPSHDHKIFMREANTGGIVAVATNAGNNGAGATATTTNNDALATGGGAAHNVLPSYYEVVWVMRIK